MVNKGMVEWFTRLQFSHLLLKPFLGIDPTPQHQQGTCCCLGLARNCELDEMIRTNNYLLLFADLMEWKQRAKALREQKNKRKTACFKMGLVVLIFCPVESSKGERLDDLLWTGLLKSWFSHLIEVSQLSLVASLGLQRERNNRMNLIWNHKAPHKCELVAIVSPNSVCDLGAPEFFSSLPWEFR